MQSNRWPGFRSVLCPIDFSEHSRLALRYAETIASRGNAALGVVYANDPLLIAAAAAALHDRDVARRSARELQEFVDSTLSPSSRKRLRIKSRVSIGDPSSEILKSAARHRCDLIVLGTHGLTGADRLLMGSTTLSVLQRTRVPVLAVPLTAGAAPASVPPSWPGGRIVAALELSGAAARDVDLAARIAKWFGASLSLVHIVDKVIRPEWLSGDSSAHDRTRVDRAQAQLDTLAARVAPVKAEARVVCGRIVDEIAALAASERAGLLITALHDRRGWFGARRGSISYHVLTQAVAPVLAYPPEWRIR